jgi:hypothetical protein
MHAEYHIQQQYREQLAVYHTVRSSSLSTTPICRAVPAQAYSYTHKVPQEYPKQFKLYLQATIYHTKIKDKPNTRPKKTKQIKIQRKPETAIRPKYHGRPYESLILPQLLVLHGISFSLPDSLTIGDPSYLTAIPTLTELKLPPDPRPIRRTLNHLTRLANHR